MGYDVSTSGDVTVTSGIMLLGFVETELSPILLLYCGRRGVDQIEYFVCCLSGKIVKGGHSGLDGSGEIKVAVVVVVRMLLVRDGVTCHVSSIFWQVMYFVFLIDKVGKHCSS